MKKPLRLYHLALSAFFLTLPAWAQESSPSDEIVVKATNALIFQMNANMHLTQDQISALEPVIAENIVKLRNLQQSLEDGTIDAATMISQKAALQGNENEELGSILSSDQMRTWANMQNQSDDENHGHHNK